MIIVVLQPLFVNEKRVVSMRTFRYLYCSTVKVSESTQDKTVWNKADKFLMFCNYNNRNIMDPLSFRFRRPYPLVYFPVKLLLDK